MFDYKTKHNMFPLLPTHCPGCRHPYFGEEAHGKNDGVTQPEMLQCCQCTLSYPEALRSLQEVQQIGIPQLSRSQAKAAAKAQAQRKK